MKRGAVSCDARAAGAASRSRADPHGAAPLGTPMPYIAVHQPEFVAASEATFLQDDDILLGVASGSVAKAYPAADCRSTAPCSTPCRTGPSR